MNFTYFLDLFEKKLKIVPLSQYYPNFQGGDNFELACSFMQKRFQEVTAASRYGLISFCPQLFGPVLFSYLTDHSSLDAYIFRANSIFIHFTCAIDTDSVGKIIKVHSLLFCSTFSFFSFRSSYSLGFTQAIT